MTTLASRTIAALRAEHDELARVAAALSPAQLTGSSGASEWTVADVLSHMGSGAEITLAGFRAALGTAPEPGPDFNQSVWDRWDATAPAEQAAGFVRTDAELVAALEELSPEQQESVTVKMGFLPEPLPIAAFAGMRLSEVAQHSWDVRAGVDPAAALAAESATVLAEQYAGNLSFLLGFIAKPDTVREPAVIAIDATPYAIVIDGQARISADAPAPTATFTGPLESAVRLLAGRLTPRYTPAGVEVTGNITLDELRRVFPGF